MATRSYAHHFSKAAAVNATPDEVFAYVDSHERLTSHMMRSSTMMAGGRMNLFLDEKEGRAVGAVIGMSGRMFGLNLTLQEVVTEREPPMRKSWETIGQPKLYVIGLYRMGFAIAQTNGHTMLTVIINYDLPSGLFAWIGWLLGGFYARWCVVNMVEGVVKHFESPTCS
ncbi:SRPBCC family protein [Novosphingobium sp. JCM 18896]|uniref:SRPBCC family protein n=1 Tax=Novosphingobium sp. JCM 18896 TaxID=2989731 RepID=UPI002221FEC2|nr:SRPBCC family protein [Novosphingobium sp. JCM 18896]